MAHIDLTCTNPGTASVRKNGRVRVNYTVSNGIVSVTSLEGYRTDGYTSYGNNSSNKVTVTVGGVSSGSKQCNLIKFGASNQVFSWSEFSSTHYVYSGNNEITVKVDYCNNADISGSNWSANINVPTPSALVYTRSVTGITRTAATLNTAITSNPGTYWKLHWYNTSKGWAGFSGDRTASGNWSYEQTNLSPNTAYNFYTQVTNHSNGEGSGLNAIGFTTSGNAPTSTAPAITPSRTSATGTATITYDVNASYSSGSFAYSTTNGVYTTSGNISGNGSGVTVTTGTLVPNTTYYYRMIVTDNWSRSVTKTGNFKTTANAPTFNTPTVTAGFTDAVINITATPDTNVTITGYKTYYKLSTSSTYQNVNGLSLNNLLSGSIYNYYVTATDSLGKTATSATYSFNTRDILPPTTDEVGVTLSHNDTIEQLSIGVSCNADSSYRLYYTLYLEGQNGDLYHTYNDFIEGSGSATHTYTYTVADIYTVRMVCYYALASNTSVISTSTTIYSNSVDIFIGPRLFAKYNNTIIKYPLYDNTCPTPRLAIKYSDETRYVPLQLGGLKNLMVKDGLSTPKSDTSFWSNHNANLLTPLTDGWVRANLESASSVENYANSVLKLEALANMKPDTTYTVYCEFKDCTFEGSGVFNIGQTSATEQSIFTGRLQVLMDTIKQRIADDPYGIGTHKGKLITKSIDDFNTAVLSMRNFITYHIGSYGGVTFRMMVIEGDYTSANITYTKYTELPVLFTKNGNTVYRVLDNLPYESSSVFSITYETSAEGINTIDFDTGEELRQFIIDNKTTFINHCKVVAELPEITTCYQLFDNCKVTSLDLSEFNTSNVTIMSAMFRNSQATSLDLSGFDTSSVTDMSYMFNDYKATTLDLSSFDTSNVTSMESMFYNSQATTLDLSSFDTFKVTTMNNMFYGSQATTGYARTQADADRFNASSNKPDGLVFVVPFCFVEKTPVLMSNGNYKPINDIVIGDKVMCYDFSTDKLVTGDVVNLLVKEISNQLVNIETSNCITLCCTETHTFFVHKEGKCVRVRAGQLKANDILYYYNGDIVSLTKVKRVSDIDKSQKVYNLTVSEPYHNYIVDGVVVSNKIW